jgi:hypothetical protein
MADYRDSYPRVEVQKLMGGVRLPAVRPCVVVNETRTGNVSFVHYDRNGFRLRRSGTSEFTAEAWGRAVAYATERRVPIFRSGTHETEAERNARLGAVA